MPHYTPLISTIVAGLVMAFVLGGLAQRLRVSPIAGYLLAGVVVGPFTPGFVADAAIARELAELGVILLMFGVGLHFSLRDLMAVRRVALPGAVAQIVVATLMGTALAVFLGWGWSAGFVFGLALSVASTVVLLRALQVRNLTDTERGRIAIGWLIVEDIVTVFALVMLPPIAAATQGLGPDQPSVSSALAGPIVGTVFKIVGFVALMLIVGRRIIPHLLHWVVHTGSRELFRLSVLAIALGVAFGAAFVFDVSFALGAFFAGTILGETQLSRRAAEETLPLRDAFAVLFFVSVGMLFDPEVVAEQPLPLLATLAIIVLGKSLAAYLIVRAFGHPNQTALVIAASLAQIGEFSFILVGLGLYLQILPPEARDLVLAGAIISILLNPLIFTLVAGTGAETEAAKNRASSAGPEPEPPKERHAVLVGYGNVGRIVAAEMMRRKKPFVLVEAERDIAREAEAAGLRVVTGNGADKRVLKEAGIESASRLLVALPEGFEAGALTERARVMNPDIQVIARAHSDDEVSHLSRLGARHVVTGEQETAARMVQLASGA